MGFIVQITVDRTLPLPLSLLLLLALLLPPPPPPSSSRCRCCSWYNQHWYTACIATIPSTMNRYRPV
jgi:hypothetical protein